MMGCEAARGALSAALDDEAMVPELETARQHRETCAACSIWTETLHEVNHALRVHEANVPDLTASILEEWDRANARRFPPRLVRVGLALVGAANLLVAAMFLTGAGAGFLQPVAEHPGRELAAFSATLAAAFLLSAIDGRARARLGVVGVAVALLVLTAAADVVSSHTHLVYEVPHLANVVGFALLWVLSRFEPFEGSPGPGLRRHHESRIEKAA